MTFFCSASRAPRFVAFVTISSRHRDVAAVLAASSPM